MSPDPEGDGDGDARHWVAICVCTHRRPEVLEQLLDRLVAVARDAEKLARTAVVVVDDDADASARAVADAHRDDFEGGVVYVVTGSGNISTARNRALDEGMAAGDWLALTDDDCLPREDWLRQLLIVQERFDADIVTGYCLDLPPDGAPRWYVEEPWLDPPTVHPDGARIDVGWVKNTLLRSDAVREHGLRFDEAFGQTGGEDAAFFHDIAALGLHHRHAAAAIVEETVPLHRTKLRYQLLRALWYGNSEANTTLRAGRSRRLRLAASSAKRMLGGFAHVIGRLRARQPSQWRWGVAIVLTGLGRLSRVFGIRLRHSTVNAFADRPLRRRPV